MKKLLVSVFIFSLVIFSFGMITSTSVFAAEQLKTVTLEVDDMTCNMCPITVKKALRNLAGVKEVSAKYEGNGEGWAKITYDSNIINVEDLTATTKKAGYPSRVKKLI